MKVSHWIASAALLWTGHVFAQKPTVQRPESGRESMTPAPGPVDQNSPPQVGVAEPPAEGQNGRIDAHGPIGGEERAGELCGGIAGLPCAEGETCVYSIGACFPDAAGTCRPSNENCPARGRPVCGCDGVTYRNACAAQKAGAAISHRGACEGQCFNRSDCPTGNCCIFPDGTCGTSPGRCQARPEFCPTVFDPVCGCDGQTYSNACFAAMECESVDTQGECEDGCTSNEECAETEYCEFAPGACAPPGQCTVRPEVCIQIYDPVCGCDGQTYSNSCVAAAAGVSVELQGECADNGGEE